VPAERDQDFRDWFAWSNDQLRETEGLKSRRLLRSADGSYAALVEHDSADTFAAMHTAESVAGIHGRLGQIVEDGPQATRYDVVVDFATSGSCCGHDDHGTGSHEGSSQTRASGECCRKA